MIQCSLRLQLLGTSLSHLISFRHMLQSTSHRLSCQLCTHAFPAEEEGEGWIFHLPSYLLQASEARNCLATSVLDLNG